MGFKACVVEKECGEEGDVNMIHESSRDQLKRLCFVVDAMHSTKIEGF